MLTVIHCPARWHTHQYHNSWQLPRQQLENPIQGLKRRVASVLGSNYAPVLRQLMNIPPTLCNSLPFTLTLLYIWCLHPNCVEKLICELTSHFSILRPLNKACAVPVSRISFCHWLHESDWNERLPGRDKGSWPRLEPQRRSSWSVW